MIYILYLILLLSVDISIGQIDRESAVLKYIENKLAKGGIGYGWEDQPDGHLTPTFAAIGILNHLNELPSNRYWMIMGV